MVTILFACRQNAGHSQIAAAIARPKAGPGCRNCITLENVQQAFGKAGIKAVTEHATDYGAIMGYGIMSTPGLVVNNEVVVAGRVPHSRRHR
ncbi:thioredoxin family protein [Arcanobacterium haemolyticum]